MAIRPGSKIRIVGTEVNTLPYWLVAGKHVKSYKDLKRPVTVGISSPTSGNVYVSLKLLEAAGIPTKDARLVKVGGSSARLAGVKAGKIDVGSLRQHVAGEESEPDRPRRRQPVRQGIRLQPDRHERGFHRQEPREGHGHARHHHSHLAFLNDPANGEEIVTALVGTGLLLGGQALAQEKLRIPVAQTNATTWVIHKGFFKDIGYDAKGLLGIGR